MLAVLTLKQNKGESMNLTILSIFLHLGKIIQAGKDVEKSVADLLTGKPSTADLQAVLSDIASLVTDGLVSIPGIDASTIAGIIADLEKVI